MVSLMSPQARVLVVDDEKFIRDVLCDFLVLEGYEVRAAETGLRALAELEHSHFDVVLTDLKMPELGGLQLLEQIAVKAPHVVTVVMTGFGTVETAIDAMKRGAYEYVLKPFRVEEVLHVIRRAADKRLLVAENLRLKEALSLYKVSEAIQSALSLDELLAAVSSAARDEIGADLVSVWVADPTDGWKERVRHVRSEGEGAMADADFGAFDPAALAERLGSGSFVAEQNQRAAQVFKTQPALPVVSVVAMPLRAKGALVGMVALASTTPNYRFDEGHRKLMTLVTSRASQAIENGRLYEDLQASFQQTIEGLAKAIDKMDRYTAGHSERVAVYSHYLAKRLKMSPETQGVVRHSALMHDIGKLGCVMNLNKPGKLTSEEYEAFTLHPTFGRDILEPIKFLHPLIPGVYMHHERWDGRGYPLGRAGNDVHEIARVISIADTYDAMTSDRAYRRALPHEVAMGEIERCAGGQFDPEMANTFCSVIDDFRVEETAGGRSVPE